MNNNDPDAGIAHMTGQKTHDPCYGSTVLIPKEELDAIQALCVLAKKARQSKITLRVSGPEDNNGSISIEVWILSRMAEAAQIAIAEFNA